jgi:hypothetical protein
MNPPTTYEILCNMLGEGQHMFEEELEACLDRLEKTGRRDAALEIRFILRKWGYLCPLTTSNSKTPSDFS